RGHAPQAWLRRPRDGRLPPGARARQRGEPPRWRAPGELAPAPPLRRRRGGAARRRACLLLEPARALAVRPPDGVRHARTAPALRRRRRPRARGLRALPATLPAPPPGRALARAAAQLHARAVLGPPLAGGGGEPPLPRHEPARARHQARLPPPLRAASGRGRRHGARLAPRRRRPDTRRAGPAAPLPRPHHGRALEASRLDPPLGRGGAARADRRTPARRARRSTTAHRA